MRIRIGMCVTLTAFIAVLLLMVVPSSQARPAGSLKGETKLVVTSVKNVNKAGEASRQEVKYVVYSEYWEDENGTKADLYQIGLSIVTGEPIVDEERATLASLLSPGDDPNDTTLWNGKAFTATFGSLVNGERYAYQVEVCMVRPARGGVPEVTYQARPNCLLWENDDGLVCSGVVGVLPPAVNGFSLIWGAGSPTSSLGHIGGSGTYGNPAAPTTQGYAGNSAEVIIAWKPSAGNPEAYYKIYDPELPGSSFEAWTDVLPPGTWNFTLYQIRICESQLTMDPTPSSFAAIGGTGLEVP